MAVYQKIYTPPEVVKSLPALDLPPTPSPKLKAVKKAESSYTGVSTSYALSQDPPHWYALRCTYGREKTAYEYMTAKGITAFYPTQTTVKLIKGKRKTVTESLLPNIFFAYGTLDQLKHFVYDNAIVSLAEVPKFKKGQMVRVTDGAFKGVIGRVARWQGQQRVGVVVDDLVTVVTAYVPSAFLEMHL